LTTNKITCERDPKELSALSRIHFRDTSVSRYTMGIFERGVGGLNK